MNKVFFFQTDATGTMCQVSDPRTGTLLFAGALLDGIEFLKKSSFVSNDEKN